MQSPLVTTQTPPQPTVWRSISLGVVITLAINAIIPYIQHTLHTVSLVEGMIPMGVLMPFLIFVFVINPFLRLSNPRYCLHSWELIIIVSILFVSSHTDEFLSRAISVFSDMFKSVADSP